MSNTVKQCFCISFISEKGFINIDTPEERNISLYIGQSVALTVMIEAYPNVVSWNWVHHTSDNAPNVSTQKDLLPNGTYRFDFGEIFS